MSDREYDVDLDVLPHRAVARTPVLLPLVGAPGNVAAALDPETGGFVYPPALFGTSRVVLALAPDGRTAAVVDVDPFPASPVVGLHDLATGHERWLVSDERESSDHLAQFSPDGTALAVLTTASDPDDDPETGGLTVVSVIDLAGGGRRRLWTRSKGGWSAESGIGWSPDGRRIAATYLRATDEDDDGIVTVVLDLTGREIAHLDQADLVPPTNAAWVDEDHVVCRFWRDDSWPHVSVDVRDGGRTVVGDGAAPLAGVGQRMFFTGHPEAGPAPTLYAANRDGSDPRPFLTLRGPAALQGCLLAAEPAGPPR
ncbi:TolB family protein [Micromonospora humi]|uniref:WD40-like Beta Propeller Repeat n=1 Tax=Micromonospora humi TaxID=745366 RepID=A0A1C5JWR8_9ACTN|nr:PD40 domain-containing protein [Micromonospora humi]SCG74761.1 WD40-like Beta Propeller Repeat [Micromonospora humi]